MPYTVALALDGLVLGALHLFQAPVLTHDLVFTLFLPGLIYGAYEFILGGIFLLCYRIAGIASKFRRRRVRKTEYGWAVTHPLAVLFR